MYKKCIKRILDIVISLILIVLLIPLFIIMALITKIEFNGKVIYKQKRIGLNEKEFIAPLSKKEKNILDDLGLKLL